MRRLLGLWLFSSVLLSCAARPLVSAESYEIDNQEAFEHDLKACIGLAKNLKPVSAIGSAVEQSASAAKESTSGLKTESYISGAIAGLVVSRLKNDQRKREFIHNCLEQRGYKRSVLDEAVPLTSTPAN